MTPLPSLSEIAAQQEGEPLTPAEVDEQVALYVDDDELVPWADRDPALARWVPANEAAAAWAMDKLRALNAELAEVVAHRAMLEDQIKAWFEDRTKNPKGRAQFLAAALEAYGLRWAAEDEKRRTLHLAGGGSIAVTVPKTPTVTVTDEAAVLRWARENAVEANPPRPGPQDCINTKPDTLYINEVRKWVKATEVEMDPVCTCGHDRDEHHEEAGACTVEIVGVAPDEDVRCGCQEYDQADSGTLLVGVYPATGEVVPGVVVEPPGPPHARVVL
jgi:hypothetical protein